MRICSFLLGFVTVLCLVANSGCGPGSSQLTREAEKATAEAAATQQKATANAAATKQAAALTQAAKDNPNANGNDSANVPKNVVTGVLLPGWPQGSTNPALAFDGQGHLNLFGQTSTSSSSHSFAQAQMNADGTWTSPTPAAPDFQYLFSLDLLPAPSGGLCMLWSGSHFDASGDSVYGLFRNCQKADGSWGAEATQVAATDSPATFSVSQAPAGALQAVYLSQNVLYFSPIGSKATGVLSGTQLSADKHLVVLARLVLDSKGGEHAAWVETSGGSSTFSIEARDSSDGGKTWSPASQLYSGTALNPSSLSFELAADTTGQAHLAWDGDHSIWYRRWTAGGWGEAVKLSGAAQGSGVRLAVTKDGLARGVWSNMDTSRSVVLAAQAADGTWGAPQTVAPTQPTDEALAVDAQGTSHVVWSDFHGLNYLAVP